ncbi:MAG: glycosyltransferase family A protein [Terriglobales bacterium]
MFFSLICGTAGRTRELERMLASLATQLHRDFELLLVDQNADDRAERILATFPQLHVIRLQSPAGVCRAFNLGLRHATGEVIGFPDDDCWYEQDFLKRLANLFQAHSDWDGLTVPTADEQGRPSIARWDKHPGRLTKTNIGMRGCSTSVFYRRDVCEDIGTFDEAIGEGISLVNPGSDIDYLHRVIRGGFHVQYRTDLLVRHPQTLPGIADEKGKRKRYQYGYGEGSMVRKYSVPLWYAGAIVLFPFARAIKQVVSGNGHLASKEWLTFRGRIDGWLQSRPLR